MSLACSLVEILCFSRRSLRHQEGLTFLMSDFCYEAHSNSSRYDCDYGEFRDEPGCAGGSSKFRYEPGYAGASSNGMHWRVSSSMWRSLRYWLCCLVNFSDMEEPDCVKSFEAYASALKQIDVLVDFYGWCKDTRIGRSSEYAEVQKITEKLL
ncbi:hypothetical protein NE237_030685 [Protea cynaroides]|uniref:AP180 N-terminal homology (ANTH) domain-containing protein n=1 Tax=Protea cynaroides TaxID=273540 RepID=A0A9Q0JXJ1_9MAGN|nr:hypothetical protein NE237_030685 [Protea cynaroides]